MPFDGLEPGTILALEKLDAVTAVIGREDQWCKGSLVTSDGRHCLVGAMRAAHAHVMLEPVMLEAIRSVTGRRYWRIEHFNDHRTTTHALVTAVLNEARQGILSGQLAAKPADKHAAGKALVRWARHLGQRFGGAPA